MRRRGEQRQRTAFVLSGDQTVLVDCGPDISRQLAANDINSINAVLITHEHGDHFLGLDELVSFKRNSPRGEFSPIPIYMTPQTREVVESRFSYLEGMGVVRFQDVEIKKPLDVGGFQVVPFKTNHGSFATGSVGYIIRFFGEKGEPVTLVYTSDFVDLPEEPPELERPDILIIQSFWLNEPVNNRPNHMSFQRALPFISRWAPRRETYLVHIGDGDMVQGDPANVLAKKYEPADPLTPPNGGKPYPIPLCQDEWQDTVGKILRDRGLPLRVVVARDGLRSTL
jgi:phosphoribosyl 1,2-cyclic phosphate phosphodiesterase